MQPSVGWIGLGNIGLPMALRTKEAGFALRLWARRREAAQVLIAQGAVWSDSPEALARECRIIATIVNGPDDVRELYGRMLPAARPGTAFVEMTTAAPAIALELNDLALRADAAFLDAPVTGGVEGARQGRLTSFVGGDESVLARCRPLLEAFSSRITHCGAPGSGYRMKLVNQTIVAGTLLGLADAAALARAGGLDAAAVVDALGAGTASGVLFHSYLPRMIASGGEVTFTLAMLRKDLRLARDEAILRQAGTRLLDFALAAVDTACARFGERAGVQCLAAEGSE